MNKKICLVILMIFCTQALVAQNSLIWYDWPKDINAAGGNLGRGITSFSNGHSLQIMEVQGDYVVGGTDTINNKVYRFHYAPDFSLLDLKPVNYTSAPLGTVGYVFGHGNLKDRMYLYLSGLTGTYSFDSINNYTYTGGSTSNVLIAYDDLGNYINLFDFDSSSLARYIGVDHSGGPVFFDHSYYGSNQTFRYINLDKNLSGIRAASPYFTLPALSGEQIYPRVIIPIENNQFLSAGILSGDPDIDPTSAVFHFGPMANEFNAYFAFMDSNFHVLTAKRFEFESDISDIRYDNGKILILGRYIDSPVINTINGAFTLPYLTPSNLQPIYNNFILRTDTSLVADWVYYFTDTINNILWPMNSFNCSPDDKRGMFLVHYIGSAANQTNSGVIIDPEDQVLMMYCDTSGNIDLYGHMQHPVNQNGIYAFPQVVLNDSTAFLSSQMIYPINLSMNAIPLYINQGQLAGSVYAAYRLRPVKKYSAKGRLIADLNGDFVVDSTDVPIVSHSVASSPSLNTTFTVQDGIYSMMVDSGTNILKGSNLMYFNSCQPPFYSINLTDSFPVDTGNVFYYIPEVSICDLKIELTGQTSLRTGRPYLCWVNASNKGTISGSGSVHVRFNGSKLQFDSASISPSAIYSDSVVFPMMDFQPMETKSFRMYFSAPQILPLGDVLEFSAIIEPDATCDTYLINNSDTITAVYLNSFDPNNKILEGPSIVYYNTVDSSFTLPYTIHFQNTGNDTAFQVILVDTLSSLLDLSTLGSFQSSHPCSFLLEQDSVLVVTFNNILLPDSGTNYSQSEGYFSFSVKPKLPVQNGDVIENSAAIYFDFNTAVITDPSIVAFTSPASLVNVDQNNSGHVVVIPNPVKGMARVLINVGHKVEVVEIADLMGRRIFALGHPDGNVHSFDTSFLPAGMYIVSVKFDNGQQISTKFVKE